MNPIQQAIIKTICYADVFDYPLKQSEIFTYLIWEQKQKSPRQNNLIPVLFNLTKSKTIQQTSGFFHLPGREDIVALRKNRLEYSLKKTKLAQKLIQHIASNQNILGIFLTGALAMNNAGKDDDIDIMIITKTNKLWTTRLTVTFKLQLKGIRRNSSTQPGRVTNLLCTNMYLDETALSVPTKKQNLYTAHEVIQVKPLVNKHQTYECFLIANEWISLYLPNITLPQLKTSEVKVATTSEIKFTESLAFKLQHSYMKRKITRETITPHMAYFHPRNTSRRIMNQYQSQLSKIENLNS